jgi:hypothetical protein
VLRAADDALYAAKDAGRDRIVVSTARPVPPKPPNDAIPA